MAGDSIFLYTTVYIITFFNLHAQGCCKLHTEDLHYLKFQSGRIITHGVTHVRHALKVIALVLKIRREPHFIPYLQNSPYRWLVKEDFLPDL